jgi:hypothetical protein
LAMPSSLGQAFQRWRRLLASARLSSVGDAF